MKGMTYQARTSSVDSRLQSWPAMFETSGNRGIHMACDIEISSRLKNHILQPSELYSNILKDKISKAPVTKIYCVSPYGVVE